MLPSSVPILVKSWSRKGHQISNDGPHHSSVASLSEPAQTAHCLPGPAPAHARREAWEQGELPGPGAGPPSALVSRPCPRAREALTGTRRGAAAGHQG